MLESTIHLRIDDRLIHGQITTAWVHKLQADHILIASDEVAKDEFQKSFLSAAAPSNVSLSILTIEDTITEINLGKISSDKIFLLVKNPKDLLRIIQGGVFPIEINLGNKAKVIESIRITKSVHLTEEEINIFRQLKEMNISISLQMVPTDAKKDLFRVLDI